MEHYTYHISPSSAAPCNWKDLSEGGQQPIPEMATAFHEYAVEVALGRFSFAVDGKVVFNSTSHPSISVHDVPWYVILNFAIGGPWPKPVSPATVFPVDIIVDYVRVSRPASLL